MSDTETVQVKRSHLKALLGLAITIAAVEAIQLIQVGIL